MLPDCFRRKKTANVCCVFWLPCLPCENDVNESIRMNKNQIHPTASCSLNFWGQHTILAYLILYLKFLFFYLTLFNEKNQ